MANVGPSVTPTCVTGTIPTGTGGTIQDGTYVLTAQTYYGATTCPQTPLSLTIVIAGDCWQDVLLAGPANLSTSSTAASTLVVGGNQVTNTSTCAQGQFSRGVSSSTFTVSGAILTLYNLNSGVGDVINVFTRQ